MTFQGISTGTGPNQGDGDTLLDGAAKINSNFSEIYNSLGKDGITINAIIEPDGIDTGSIVATGLTVTGDVYVTGTLDVDSDVTLGSGVTITGVLDVDTSAEIDNVRIDGNTVDTTSGNLTLDSADGLVDINDDVDISGTLDVDGNVTLGNASSDTVTINGSATVAETLNADGDVNLGSNNGDTITANGRFDSSLVPSADNTYDLGTSTIRWNDLWIQGTADIENLEVDQNAIITKNLTVNGDVTLGNADTDTVTVNGDLDVGNVITGEKIRLSDNVITTISGNDGLTLQSFNFSGVDVKGSFTTNGDTTLGNANDTHTLNGNTTINGDLTVTGDVSGIDATSIKDSNDTVRAQATTSGVTIDGDLTFGSTGGFSGMLLEKGYRNTNSFTGEPVILLERGHVHRYTTANPSLPSTPNFRYSAGTGLKSIMNVGDVVSVTIIIPANNNYLFSQNPAKVKIDGTQVDTYFVGGAQPSSGGTGAVDIYNITIYRDTTATDGFFAIVSQSITQP